jgi:hypothetical protein
MVDVCLRFLLRPATVGWARAIEEAKKTSNGRFSSVGAVGAGQSMAAVATARCVAVQMVSFISRLMLCPSLGVMQTVMWYGMFFDAGMVVVTTPEPVPGAATCSPSAEAVTRPERTVGEAHFSRTHLKPQGTRMSLESGSPQASVVACADDARVRVAWSRWMIT